MKKILSLLLCLLAGFGTAHADEGMWLLKLMKDMKASQGGMEYPILVDEDDQEFYVRDLVITEDRELIYEFRYTMDSESDWQLVIVPEEEIAEAITELEECFYE